MLTVDGKQVVHEDGSQVVSFRFAGLNICLLDNGSVRVIAEDARIIRPTAGNSIEIVKDGRA